VADRSVSVPMTLSGLEKQEARGQFFPGDLRKYANEQTRHGNTSREACVCLGRHPAVPRGEVPASAPPKKKTILGLPFAAIRMTHSNQILHDDQT